MVVIRTVDKAWVVIRTVDKTWVVRTVDKAWGWLGWLLSVLLTRHGLGGDVGGDVLRHKEVESLLLLLRSLPAERSSFMASLNHSGALLWCSQWHFSLL